MTIVWNLIRSFNIINPRINMKKLLFSILLIATACTQYSTSSNSTTSNNPEDTTPTIIKYSNSLVKVYPNMNSNSIAESAVRDSISNYASSFVNKSATFLEGIIFSFERIIENPQTGAFSALFSSSVTSSLPDENNPEMASINVTHIKVVGVIPESVASTLDVGIDYNLSGIVHAWDGNNLLTGGYHELDGIDFGTFVLDSMIVVKK